MAMETSKHERQEDTFSFITELPRVMPRGREELVNWKGFWVMPEIIRAAMCIEAQFEPLPTDIILVSFPKTGTTWLKALTITLLEYHKSKQDSDLQVDDPLLTKNPHQLVPFLELECFGEHTSFDISKMSTPRVFNTHLPYSMLPDNIKNSHCNLVYISRNPMDTFVSNWHFFHKNRNTGVTIHEAFERFCQGVTEAGPYFDHVLEYWKVSNEKEGMFFLTYEELKKDPYKHVKALAEFLGCSLNPDEIEQVVWKCSHDRLSNLEVNKDTSVVHWAGWDFRSYFRRGIVGDSKNYLTPDMVEELGKIARQKWAGSGLKFQAVDEIMGSSE